MAVRYALALTLLFCLSNVPSLEPIAAEKAAAVMGLAAIKFLDSLTPEQRAKAVFSFGEEERLNWHFVPRARKGMPLKDMTDAQRARATELLQAGLSQRGYLKVQTIMELELVLRELGQNPSVRDPQLYFFSVFGTPSGKAPWGWRVEGHHLSLNFTILEGMPVAAAPAFFGANPATVPSGPKKGLRALAAEEDLARALVVSLDANQRSAAILSADAPDDILSSNKAQTDPLAPVGIAAAQLTREQTGLLRELLDEYLSRMPTELAAERRTKLEKSDFGTVAFAWAGSLDVGQRHYYRVQGPTFLIEYDNTQNNANHIHSVWRDFDGDFGRDLLREHYRSIQHPH